MCCKSRLIRSMGRIKKMSVDVIKDAQSILSEVLGFFKSGEPIHPGTAEEICYLLDRINTQLGGGNEDV